MTLGTKDHDELIEMFDKVFKGRRLDKEAKDMWSRGHVYQDGSVNDLFLAFRHGVAFERARSRL